MKYFVLLTLFHYVTMSYATVKALDLSSPQGTSVWTCVQGQNFLKAVPRLYQEACGVSSLPFLKPVITKLLTLYISSLVGVLTPISLLVIIRFVPLGLQTSMDTSFLVSGILNKIFRYLLQKD